MCSVQRTYAKMLWKSLLVFVILASTSTLSAINAAAILGESRSLTGTELHDAVEKLNVALNKVAALNGPAYTVLNINQATQQVVEGLLTRYIAMPLIKLKVELVNKQREKKNCDVTIWSRTWLEEGIEVTFECGGEP